MSYLRTQFSRLFRAGPQPLRCRSTQVQGLFEHIPAQQQALLNLVQAQSNRYADTAALFQALGGGWWNRPDVPKT